MSEEENCIKAWSDLINAIGNAGNGLDTLTPYGKNVCDALKEQIKNGDEKLEYDGVKEALDALRENINERVKGKEKYQKENEELKSQNFQQTVGLKRSSYRHSKGESISSKHQRLGDP